MALDRKEVLARAKDLGIEHHKTAKTTAIAKMIEDLTGDILDVETPKVKEDKGSDTIRCIIHSNDKDNDELEAVGSLNGETWQVILGEEIDFPKKFVTCIRDAYVDTKIAILDEDGQPTGKYKERRRQNFIIEKL